MKTLENFKEKAENQGLQLMGLTGASNGYPEPDLGWFAHGFENYEEAQEFAEQTDGVIIFGKWRNGWSYAYNNGEASGSFPAPSSDWYGDNYQILDEPYTMDDLFDYLGYSSIKEAIEYEGKEKIKEMKESFLELINDCNSYVDWDKQVAILHEGGYYETISKNPMNFCHDTMNEAVGVAFEFAE